MFRSRFGLIPTAISANCSVRAAWASSIASAVDSGFLLEGAASGIEAFVLLARDEPLPPENDLRPLLTSWTSTTDQAGNLAVAAWLENGKQDTNPMRGGSFAVQAKVNNTIGKVRALTQTLFEKHGLSSRAIRFGYRGAIAPIKEMRR